MTVTVGIDIGTTSVKALAADDDGTVLREIRIPHDFRTPTPTGLEHDARKAWLDGPRAALGQVGPAEAVAVAAMVPSMTAVDEQGTPLTPGILYGDERGQTEIEAAASPSGGSEAVGFLEWTARSAPAAAGYWTAQALANFGLLGEAVMDQASAASLYPVYGGTDWDVGLLEQVGVTVEQLPKVVGLGESAGQMADGTTVASGLVDALGEQLVAGADAEGDVLVIFGATLLTWIVESEYRAVDRLMTIPHTTPGKFLVGGPSNAGGLFVSWSQRLLGEDEREVDPSGVPVWAPYPRGERTPLNDPEARASIGGLDMTHGPAAALRAAREAAGFVVRRNIEMAGASASRIVLTGGGANDAELVQALADCTDLPVSVVAVPEGAALGAAFTARVALGVEPDLAGASRWASVSTIVEPRGEWREHVDRRFDRFLRASAR